MLNIFDYALIVAAVVASLTAAIITAILRGRAPGTVIVAAQRPGTVGTIYGSLEMRETFKPSSPLPMRMGEALASVQFGPEADVETKTGNHEDDLYRWLEGQSSDAKRISSAVRVRASESLAAHAA